MHPLAVRSHCGLDLPRLHPRLLRACAEPRRALARPGEALLINTRHMYIHVGHVSNLNFDEGLSRKRPSSRLGPPFDVVFARRTSPCSSLPTLFPTFQTRRDSGDGFFWPVREEEDSRASQKRRQTIWNLSRRGKRVRAGQRLGGSVGGWDGDKGEGLMTRQAFATSWSFSLTSKRYTIGRKYEV